MFPHARRVSHVLLKTMSQACQWHMRTSLKRNYETYNFSCFATTKPWHPEFEVVTTYKSCYFELFLYFNVNFNVLKYVVSVLMLFIDEKLSTDIVYLILVFSQTWPSICTGFHLMFFCFHHQDDHVLWNKLLCVKYRCLVVLFLANIRWGPWRRFDYKLLCHHGLFIWHVAKQLSVASVS